MYQIAEWIALPFVTIFTKTVIEGEHFLPKTGSVILVSNHISFVDPLTLGLLGHRRKRQVHFLAKDALFKKTLLRWFFTSCGQIPVARGTNNASDSLIHAQRALDKGQCVGIFPEGTMPDDLVQLPIKSGAVRLAQKTAAPIVVVGIWGGHEIWRKDHRPHFGFRRRCVVVVTPPYSVDENISIDELREELAMKMKDATRKAVVRWDMTK
jgi:1-acyl-sn-glycerol-3-phosphate acyltransferase